MSSPFDRIFGTTTTRPIAFRVPADSGWRAVAVTLGEASPDGTQPIAFSVVSVASWGITGREVKPGEEVYGSESELHMQTLTIGGSVFGLGGGVDLVPLDENGQRIDAHRIVPPTNETTAAALLDEARVYLGRWNEAATERMKRATPAPIKPTPSQGAGREG